MSEFFQRAFRRARERYTQEQWVALSPGQVTDAIYREMRDMDAAVPPAGLRPLPGRRRRGSRTEITPEK